MSCTDLYQAVEGEPIHWEVVWPEWTSSSNEFADNMREMERLIHQSLGLPQEVFRGIVK